MADLPTMEELIQAVDMLKMGWRQLWCIARNAESACCDREFPDLLLSLVHQAWKERKVPKEWADTILVPIPKEGDITKCDN